MLRLRRAPKTLKSMSRRASQDAGTVIPDECLVCNSEIINNSVLFHCECIVALCQDCAILQIAAQKTTFTEGLLCPYCRKPSYNIQHVEKAKTEENCLIDEAFDHFKFRLSRSSDAIKRALIMMVTTSGIQGSLSVQELQSEEFNSTDMLASLKLELARLECLRKNQYVTASGSKSNVNTQLKPTLEGMPIPLGPLKHITFTRNTILERVIRSKKSPQLSHGSSSHTMMVHKTCQTNFEVYPSVPVDSKIIDNATSAVTSSTLPRASSSFQPTLQLKHAAKKFKGSGEIKSKIEPVMTSSRSKSSSSYDSGNANHSSNYGERACSPENKSKEQLSRLCPDPSRLPPDHPSNFKFNPKHKFCTCQTQANNKYYIKCTDGNSCNGWVHLSCTKNLEHLSEDTIPKIDLSAFVCSGCLISNPNRPHQLSVGKRGRGRGRPRSLQNGGQNAAEKSCTEESGTPEPAEHQSASEMEPSATSESKHQGIKLTQTIPDNLNTDHRLAQSSPEPLPQQLALQVTGPRTINNIPSHDNDPLHQYPYSSMTDDETRQILKRQSAPSSHNLPSFKSTITGSSAIGIYPMQLHPSQSSVLDQSISSFQNRGVGTNLNGHGRPSKNEKDEEVLYWMMTIVQSLPILLNRSIPGKEIPVEDLRALVNNAATIDVQHSTHSTKASELMRRLKRIDTKVHDMNGVTIDLLRRANVDFQGNREYEAKNLGDRVHKESVYHNHFSNIYTHYLGLGLKHGLIRVCINTFTWCYNVSDNLLRNGMNLTIVAVQNLLREGNEIEKESYNATKYIYAADPTQIANPGPTLVLRDDWEMYKILADLQETLTFELIEFWRKRLILSLIGTQNVINGKAVNCINRRPAVEHGTVMSSTLPNNLFLESCGNMETGAINCASTTNNGTQIFEIIPVISNPYTMAGGDKSCNGGALLYSNRIDAGSREAMISAAIQENLPSEEFSSGGVATQANQMSEDLHLT